MHTYPERAGSRKDPGEAVSREPHPRRASLAGALAPVQALCLGDVSPETAQEPGLLMPHPRLQVLLRGRDEGPGAVLCSQVTQCFLRQDHAMINT